MKRLGWPFLGFLGLAAVMGWRLWPNFGTHIPGGWQDTRLFLWNAWWFHYALFTLHTSPFATPLLFHPFGTSLLSHDMPLWNSVVTTLIQWGNGKIVFSVNVWFFLTWGLAGFCTYLLAHEITKKQAPALVAGLYVMTHSYLLARAMQNWGQFNLFGIPLFLWLLMRAKRTGLLRDYALGGVALAWTAACHYYFLIYSGILWLLWFLWDAWPYQYRWRFQWFKRRWRHVFLVIAMMAGGVAAWIVLKQPGALQWVSVKISLNTPTNALLVMWFCLFVWVLTGIHGNKIGWEPGWLSREWKKEILLLALALLLLSPLWINAIHLVLAGDYPRQSILWKTHLPGANFWSLLAPNAFHALWGSAVSDWFWGYRMSPHEQAASLGWVCLAVVLMARPWRQTLMGKRWTWVAGLATVFSMGTYLHVGNLNTWCPLPFYFLRLLPILGNVRVPERWMAVGSVAWGILLALALVHLANNRKWRLTPLCAIVGGLLLIENWPGIPFRPPPKSKKAYEILAKQPPGGVLTLPFYVGDSSVGSGHALYALAIFPWDHLWAQTFHKKPITGGFVGRISRRILEAYRQDPFFGSLIAIEENRLPDVTLLGREDGCRTLEKFQLRYLLIYHRATPPAAKFLTRNIFKVKRLSPKGRIELYELDRGACPDPKRITKKRINNSQSARHNSSPMTFEPG